MAQAVHRYRVTTGRRGASHASEDTQECADQEIPQREAACFGGRVNSGSKTPATARAPTTLKASV